MSERWLAVPGYKGVYEVSDQGRVRRLLRGTFIERVLRPYPNPKGYLLVGLCIRGCPRRGIGVHRLVLMAFVGPPPTPEHQGNHRDGVKSNNALPNLEWVTPSENSQHAVAHGLWRAPKGERNGRSKLTAVQVAEIRDLRGAATQRDLARRYGVSKSLINQIMLGQAWTSAEVAVA